MLLYQYKNKQTNDQKHYEKLLQDKQLIVNYLLQMQVFLQHERQKESIFHWQLIRDREHRCAYYLDESCEIFSSEFFYEDKLQYLGFPLEHSAIYKSSQSKRKDSSSPTSKKLSNSKQTNQKSPQGNDQKKVYQVTVHEYSMDELQYLSTLSGIEKIKLSICLNRTTLLPDEDARIFARLHEYMDFMKSPGGTTKQGIRTIKQIRENTLFGQFLEHGEEGYQLAVVVAFEYLGIVLSPSIFFMHYIYQNYQYCIEFLWQQMRLYTSQPYVPIEQTTLQSSCHTLSSFQDIQHCIFSYVQYYCSSTIYPTIKFILSSEDETSALSQFLVILDYSQYSGVRTIYDLIHPYLIIPSYFYELTVRAPYIYWDYYIKERYHELPPRRNSCLLRNGIAIGEAELHNNHEKLREYEKMQDLLLQYLISHRIQSSSSSSKQRYSSSLDQSLPDILTSKRLALENHIFSLPAWLIDYGPEKIYEMYSQQCISKFIQQYNYTFCFFDKIQQNNRVDLGKFVSWGNYSFFHEPTKRSLTSLSSLGLNTNIFETSKKVPLVEHDQNNVHSLNSFLFYEYLQEKELELYTQYCRLYQPKLAHYITSSSSSSTGRRLPTKTFFGLIQYAYENARFYQEYFFGYSHRLIKYNILKYSMSYSIPYWLYVLSANVIQFFSKIGKEFMSSKEGSFSFFFDWLNDIEKVPIDSFDITKTTSLPDYFSKLSKEQRTELLKPYLQAYYSQQTYLYGQTCELKPSKQRKVLVNFECGEELSLENVVESEVISRITYYYDCFVITNYAYF